MSRPESTRFGQYKYKGKDDPTVCAKLTLSFSPVSLVILFVMQMSYPLCLVRGGLC